MKPPTFVAWDICRFIPGRVYRTPSHDGPLLFRGAVFSPYDDVYHVTFFDVARGAPWERTVRALAELDDLALEPPRMPAGAGLRLRGLLRGLLSPRAEVRAQVVHRIAALGEAAIPALPWLRETAHHDDITVYDAQQRRTNPRAQAHHALARLAQIPAIAALLQNLPPIADPWVPGVQPPTPRRRPRLPG